DAHTLPELMGRRYQSKFIQVFSGLMIFIFMPIYAGVVLIGGCEFITSHFGVDYDAALLVFSVIIAVYVIAGGLKAVMYTDALQGTIMMVAMALLLIFTYCKLGGVTRAHTDLTGLAAIVPANLKAIGHQGWTAMPKFGWGSNSYNLWWFVISTLTLGVGIGCLAQPQLSVRFMTVKSQRELNRAVMLGGLFIILIPGAAYIVGSLSNNFNTQFGPVIQGKITRVVDAQKKQVFALMLKKDAEGKISEVLDKAGQPMEIPLVVSDEKPRLAEGDVVNGRTISIVDAGGNAGLVIPNFIKRAMPAWFGLLFMLTLLSAAMSTLSGQFHALGTAASRDVFEQFTSRKDASVRVTKIGIIIGIVASVIIAHYCRYGTFIARGTAIFFGLCAAAFMPAFVGGLFFKRMTKAAALWSMVTGFTVSAFWLVFIKAKEAGDIGIVQKFTGGKPSLLFDYPNWPEVDPIIIALPIAAVVAIVVSIVTKPNDEKHLKLCFDGPNA
ncbi:MAG TPA: sodium:solute symporter family protein, partial [Phycisphaerae bacterium]|nr:sodium:solute symporter family protein [Phycisphaerae bacterium]